MQCKLKNQLQKEFNLIRLFSDVDSAVVSMKTLQRENIWLITSSRLLNPAMIPSIQNLPQLCTVHVLADAKEKDDLYWVKKYCKVKGIFSNISTVCEQITVHQLEIEHSLIGLDICGQYESPPLEINSKQDGTSMCAQLFREQVTRVATTRLTLD